MRTAIKSGYGFVLKDIKVSDLIKFCREHMSTILSLSNSVPPDQKQAYDNLITFVYSNKATSENIKLECTSFAKIKDAYSVANPLSIIPAVITAETNIVMSLQPSIKDNNLENPIIILLDDAPWNYNMTEKAIESTNDFNNILRPYIKALYNDDSKIYINHYDVLYMIL